ncbi:MAG: hypothetical protein ACI8T6_000624 [Candidatus Poseidoniaceae archaeon]|jgi:hypothetical protein
MKMMNLSHDEKGNSLHIVHTSRHGHLTSTIGLRLHMHYSLRPYRVVSTQHLWACISLLKATWLASLQTELWRIEDILLAGG